MHQYRADTIGSRAGEQKLIANRIIVPFPAGGTTDLLARVFAQRMTEGLGQSVVVENMGGGGGSIGADAVAKAAPDGYTLLMANVTFSTTTASLQYAGRAKHDFDDFAPVLDLKFLYGPCRTI